MLWVKSISIQADDMFDLLACQTPYASNPVG